MESRHLTPEQLSASLDGELSATEQRVVEAHLADCGECQRELAQLEQTVGLLRALPAAVPTRSFRVTETARPVAVAQRWWAQPIWLRGLGSAAAALMVMVLAIDAVVPSMQMVGTSASGAAGAAETQLAPAPSAAQEKSDAVAPAPAQAFQRSTDNAARAVAPAAPAAGAAQPARAEDQAATGEPSATPQTAAPPSPAAASEGAGPPRPQWVLGRPAQLIGVALGGVTLLLFIAAALVRRPRA